MSVLEEKKSVGRSTLSYEEMSNRSKRRRDLENSKTFSTEEAFGIASKRMKLDGNLNGDKVLSMIREKESADNMMALLDKPQPLLMTGAQALGLIIDRRFTKTDYTTLRKSALLLHHNLYPVYYEVNLNLFLNKYFSFNS